MITLSQIFAQQPRNSPNSVSIPYCQQAPRNQELTGLFQCQFQGVNLQVFVGNVQVGGAGTIPFGLSSPVQPPGSCPANPGGTVPAGQQLVDITQNPNAPVPAGSGGNSTPSPSADPSTSPSPSPSPVQNGSPNATPTPSGDTTNGSPNDDKAADGRAAQQLNAQFATLTPDSSCTGKRKVFTSNQLLTFSWKQSVKLLVCNRLLPSAWVVRSLPCLVPPAPSALLFLS